MVPGLEWLAQQAGIAVLWLLCLPGLGAKYLFRTTRDLFTAKGHRLKSGLKLAVFLFLALQGLELVYFGWQRIMLGYDLEGVAAWSLGRQDQDVQRDVARAAFRRGFPRAGDEDASIEVTREIQDDMPICRIEARFPHTLPLHLLPRPTLKLRVKVWKVAQEKPTQKPLEVEGLS